MKMEFIEEFKGMEPRKRNRLLVFFIILWAGIFLMIILKLYFVGIPAFCAYFLIRGTSTRDRFGLIIVLVICVISLWISIDNPESLVPDMLKDKQLFPYIIGAFQLATLIMIIAALGSLIRIHRH